MCQHHLYCWIYYTNLLYKSFQLLLDATCLNGCRNLSQSSALFRKSNHFEIGKQQNQKFRESLKLNLISNEKKNYVRVTKQRKAEDLKK